MKFLRINIFRITTFVMLMTISNMLLAQNDFVRIENRWKGSNLHNQNRVIELGAIQSGWWSAMWRIEPVNLKSIRIKNRWTGEYLQEDNGSLKLASSSISSKAIWTVEYVSRDYIRLKSSVSQKYLHNQNGGVELGDIQSGWWSAMWQIKPANLIPDNQKGYSTDRVPDRINSLTTVNPQTNRYNHDRLGVTLNLANHINGLGIFNDETLIITQKTDNGSGGIYFTEPVRRKLIFKSDKGIRYQSGIQACGDFAAISTNTSIQTAEIRVYQKKNNELYPLTHLKKVIVGNSLVENAGLVYHEKLGYHFMSGNKNLYVSNGESLLNATCKFEPVTISGTNPLVFGEAGGSLLYEQPSADAPLGSLYWVSCGESGDNPYYVKLTKIELFYNNNKLNARKSGSTKSYTLKEADKTNFSIIDIGADTRPSFRWAGNFFITRLGDIKAFASERDINIHTWDVAVWSPTNQAVSDCGCPPKTFRSVSDHSWVEFRLPKGTGNQLIKISGGAYNHYVFPKCNRVHWSDLNFTCNSNTCKWEKTFGDWDADALCHGSKGNSPYVFVGDK